MKKPGAVLFMCGWNSIRSPMAEVIAKRLLPSDIYVQSAGVRAGEADPFVNAVLEELVLPLHRHRPRTLHDLEDAYFVLIITLPPQATHPALELTVSNALALVTWQTIAPPTTNRT